MFDAFPASAQNLGEDRGIFLGPRPGVFQNVELSQLRHLVEKIQGVVLLTMTDENVKTIQEALRIPADDDYVDLKKTKDVVLSIRDSKGKICIIYMILPGKQSSVRSYHAQGPPASYLPYGVQMKPMWLRIAGQVNTILLTTIISSCCPFRFKFVGWQGWSFRMSASLISSPPSLSECKNHGNFIYSVAGTRRRS